MNVVCRLLPVWPTLAVGIGLFGLQNAWFSILLYHAGILLAVWATPCSWATLGKGFHLLWAAAAIPLGLLTFAAIRVLLPFLTGIEGHELWGGFRDRLEDVGLAGSGLLGFCLYFVTVHPILEDFAWRGVLASGRTGDNPGAPQLNDFWFAMYHVPVLLRIFPEAWALAAITFLVLVIASISWREIARRTGGLQSVVLQHAAADSAILAAVLWP